MNDDTLLIRPDLQYPKLRPIEAIPLPHPEKEGICLRDPRQIAKNMLVVQPIVYYLITMFDGNHSLQDMQDRFLRQFRERIPLEKIKEIVYSLDREWYLESETFQTALQSIIEEFRCAPYRAAAYAGTAYAGDADELKAQLDGYLDEVQNQDPQTQTPNDKHLQLLIAPHIDLQRGGSCFAYAYRELMHRPPADLYMILGTGHHCIQSLMTLTKKSYTTPLGIIETDTDFVDQFSRRVSDHVFEEELLHRDEHSVEFQILWLRHVLEDSWSGKAVPILCGSFHPFVMEGKSPREDAELACMLDHLREMIGRYPGKVTVIAGVDLSHVGKKFGSELGIPPQELDRVQQDDEEVIAALCRGDAEEFYETIAKKKDRNNVCGLSPIYMALDIVRPQAGQLLHYDRALEPDTESVVTFASLAFYEDATEI